MGQKLEIVAQSAMDLFYNDFKGNDDFFDLPDFITYVGNTLTDLYLQEYRTLRQELRQEKKDEVVTFSSEWLASETIDVKSMPDGELVGEMTKRVMSFPFDNQNVGVQQLIQIVPRGTCLERSNPTEAWQYKFLPTTDRIYWRLENKDGKDRILFYKNGFGSLSKVEVKFVPANYPDSEIPDSVANYVITTTVMTMKQVIAGVVVDKTNDNNSNKVLDSEINKSSLKN